MHRLSFSTPGVGWVFGRGLSLAMVALLLFGPQAVAVPLTLSYQGHLSMSGLPFDGVGQFKLALLDGDGGTLWSNDATSVAGSEPTVAISLDVIRGGYAVRIGDVSVPHMAALSADVFASERLFLRVWFSADGRSFEPLSPDKEFSSVAYSLRAGRADYATISGTVENVPNIDASKISSGVISSARLDPALARDAEVSALTAPLQAQIDELSSEFAADDLPYVAGSIAPEDARLLDRGYRRFSAVRPVAWTHSAAVDAPSARDQQAAVWTGANLIVWGGQVAPGVFSSTGSAYDPANDDWAPIPGVDAPSARGGHSAVWTGSEMVIWGGFSGEGYLGDGARFDPETQLWTPLSMDGAPSGRSGHVAVWTGSRLIIWGGNNGDGLLADGAAYLPASDAWVPLTLPSAPAARMHAAAVWAGDRMILFGGEGASGTLGDGAQLQFSSGAPSAWVALSLTGAPSARVGHSLVWTGSAAVVFGGASGELLRDDGAAYDPVANSWVALNSAGSPSPRSHHVAIWTGDEMVIAGGTTASGTTGSASVYDPATDAWRVVSGSGSSQPRSSATAVWTGLEALLFGGLNGSARLSALQRLDPSPTLYLYRAP